MSKMSKKKKKILTVISVIVIIFAAVIIGVSYYIGTQVFNGSTQLATPENTSSKPDWEPFDSFCEKYSFRKLDIESSFDGHNIPADLIYSDVISEKTVVMVHGLGSNRYRTYPMAEFFLENGYNVIAYDQRSHNENTAEKTTFGYWEKYDLIDCIDYAKKNTGCDKVGVWGTSFGGATAVQGVAYEDTQDDVAFLVLDCPVSSMRWMLEDQMSGMNIGIPVPYMAFWGNLVNKMKLGFSYDDADGVKAAEKVNVPTLVINSEIDDTTPYFMGKDIYDALGSADKELWTVSDGEHARIWYSHNEEYREKLLSIVNKAG